MAAGKLPFVSRAGGGGEPRSEFVCGLLGCDMQPFNPVLSTLPRLLRVKRSEPESNDLLSRLIDLTLAETRQRRVGGESVRLRLSELSFVEVMRQYLESLPAHETGWLTGERQGGVQGTSVSVRVGLGWRRIIKQTNSHTLCSPYEQP